MLLLKACILYIYLIMQGTFLKKSPLEPPLASKIESSFFIKIYIYYFSALPDSLFSFSFLVGVRGQAKVVIPCWQSAQDICQVVGFVHSYCKLKRNYLPKVYLYHCYLQFGHNFTINIFLAQFLALQYRQSIFTFASSLQF